MQCDGKIATGKLVINDTCTENIIDKHESTNDLKQGVHSLGYEASQPETSTSSKPVMSNNQSKDKCYNTKRNSSFSAIYHDKEEPYDSVLVGITDDFVVSYTMSQCRGCAFDKSSKDYEQLIKKVTKSKTLSVREVCRQYSYQYPLMDHVLQNQIPQGVVNRWVDLSYLM